MFYKFVIGGYRFFISVCKCFIGGHRCVICLLYVFYKCFTSGYKCVISVFVAIFGIQLIFGLTGFRTNGPSD